MSNPNRRKRLGNDRIGDPISSLPDEILCHILSFIPTKSAVMTSLLSKRWQYIWTKVSTLDFGELPYNKFYHHLTQQQKTCLNIFVDRVLFHNDVPRIGCLRLYHANNAFYLKSWLTAIAKRNIDKIDISIGSGDALTKPILLPKNFFSYEGLVYLRLEGNFITDFLPSSSLPKLKTVTLSGVQFPSDEFLKRLTRSCVVLQELYIVGCSGFIRNMLIVESPTLKKLQILGTLGKRRDPVLCIVINTPNLRYLHIEERLTKYDIRDMNLLAEAKLLVSNDEYSLELLRKVAGAKSLQLNPKNRLFGGASSILPIFGNLTSLRLDTCVAFSILNFTPKLKFLYLDQVLHKPHSFAGISVPVCMSSLEMVEVGCFVGDEDDMEFVAYFLETAYSMKKMQILMPEMNRERERWVVQKLLMLPRCSASCIVDILFIPTARDNV